MNTLADFARALCHPQAVVPAGLHSWNGSAPQTRFNVYRNNRLSSLVAALADGHAVVAQLVGEDFFAALARAYIAAHPPRSPVLLDWADDFGAFVDDFMARLPPDAHLPYLGDVARLERLRVRATHAADDHALPVAELATRLARPDDLPRLRLRLRDSLGVLRSRWPVASLWRAHQTEGEVLLPDWRALPPESACVLRQGQGLNVSVVVVPLLEPAARFIEALQGGDTLAEAAGAAGPELDLPAALGLLLQQQAVVGCSL